MCFLIVHLSLRLRFTWVRCQFYNLDLKCIFKLYLLISFFFHFLLRCSKTLDLEATCRSNILLSNVSLRCMLVVEQKKKFDFSNLNLKLFNLRTFLWHALVRQVPNSFWSKSSNLTKFKNTNLLAIFKIDLTWFSA